VRYGSDDQLARDHLVSFRPKADEALDQNLRVFHCMLHFLSVHRTASGFRPSASAEARCPFYTCCELKLRTAEPEICRKAPWQAADWQRWDEEGSSCWYGAAVSITRPT
jgi:hypothetical protein